MHRPLNAAGGVAIGGQAEHQNMPSPATTTTPPSDTQGTVPCFDCGADTRKKWGEQTFTYGAGPDAAELRVTLPIHVCPSCGFECLDDEAETLKHEAVCAHLRLLSPKEIRGIRDAYNMSRADFSRLTGLGEATLNRWENGILIQNAANDRYLRLLKDANNVRVLRHLKTEPTTPSSATNTGRFRVIEVSPQHRQRQNGFCLVV